MAKSSVSARKDKPKKPYPDFPLFPHATRRWAKKVRGKLVYFGPWDDPYAALSKWLDEKDDLLAGRTPSRNRDGLTLRDLVNRFLTAKQHLVDSGELTQRSFRDYYQTCERLLSIFSRNRLIDDLRPEDFEKFRAHLAKTRGPVALGNEIGRCRVLFNYAYQADLIDRPVKYGQSFNKPTRKTLRQERARRISEYGVRMFQSDELLTIINALSGTEVTTTRVDDESGQPEKITLTPKPILRGMILLGINCGLGQSDCANLPINAIDLESGWLDYARPKTGIERRCPLWPETIESLRVAIQSRPEAWKPEDAGCVFLTRFGRRWVRMSESDNEKRRGATIDAVAGEFGKLLSTLDINGRRNFYCLRRTFRTVAATARDDAAAGFVMGHAPSSADMGAVYVQHIDDDRLRAVTNTVHAWLFGDRKPKRNNRRVSIRHIQ